MKRAASRHGALVYGPYPPWTGPVPTATLGTVRAFLAEGFDVVVVSPHASGAHHHADLRRTTGGFRLARLAGVAEQVVLFVEPGQLCGSLPGPAWVPPGRLAVGLALRRPRDVVVHCSAIGGALDKRSVRVVLGPASRVLVASEEDRDAFIAAGLDAGKVNVAPPTASPTRPLAPAAGRPDPAPAGSGWALPATAGRDEIQAEICRRAAGRVGAGRDTRRSGDHLPGTASTRPLLALRPLAPAATTSSKRGVGFVKQLIRRATAWQVDPVIDHVNRLQRATLEAVENQGRSDP